MEVSGFEPLARSALSRSSASVSPKQLVSGVGRRPSAYGRNLHTLGAWLPDTSAPGFSLWRSCPEPPAKVRLRGVSFEGSPFQPRRKEGGNGGGAISGGSFCRTVVGSPRDVFPSRPSWCVGAPATSAELASRAVPCGGDGVASFVGHSLPTPASALPRNPPTAVRVAWDALCSQLPAQPVHALDGELPLLFDSGCPHAVQTPQVSSCSQSR